ncbi:MAG: ABC transporter permease [Oscillospiraceae bacterium]|nr:ABC transporter permease [Oscillospiraceae bacterium]MCL2278728.1 ABC transporter permease [Oscillospiraceae bacterium]
MGTMFRYALKRQLREGIKILAVPLVAFTLVVLINALGGIREWLEYEYEYTMDNFVVVAQLSDLWGDVTDELAVAQDYISIFTDPDMPVSLYRFTNELMLRRSFEVKSLIGDIGVELIGVTGLAADAVLASETSDVNFFYGYDESLMQGNELTAIVSDDLLEMVDGGRVSINIMVNLPGEEAKAREEEVTVIGTVSSDTGDSLVYLPFWTVSALAEDIAEAPLLSELLSITLAENRELSAFKDVASLIFPRVMPVFDTRPFAMTIYDSEFFETLEPLRQNLILVDVAIPFVYIIAVGVGFLTSVLLTRQRKAEFAVMRSVGMRRGSIFTVALGEQFLLCIIGSALGLAAIAVFWGYLNFERPLIFLACYMLGAIFSAARAARTNVLLLLRERE